LLGFDFDGKHKMLWFEEENGPSSYAPLLSAIMDIQFLLHNSSTQLMRCKELVAGWPNFIGVVDASSFGIGGIVIGKLSPCRATVFCLQLPPNITASVISNTNRNGKITNLNLKMAGLLLLWLMIEHTCTNLTEKHIAIFSDNSPTVSWVQCMVCRLSLIAKQLIWVLTLRMNAQ
jgi:hypothetical protein